MILLIVVLVMAAVLLLSLIVASFLIKMVLERDNQWYDKMGHKLMNPDNYHQTTTVFDQREDQQNALGAVFWDDPTAEDYWLKRDNQKLYSRVWPKPCHHHDWVICVHGYRSTGKRDMAYAASKFSEQGFNVVVPDLRAHGKSGGTTIGMGWSDRLDILQWVEEICSVDDQAKIILYGGSMGASTVMMLSGEELPLNVTGIIADCGYSSVYDEFRYMLKNVLHLLAYPVLAFSNGLAKKKLGYSLKEASALQQLQKNKRPLLLIHGTKDKFVPHQMMYQNMEASQGVKEGLLIEDAPHLSSFIYEPEHYFNTVFRFISDYCQEKGQEGVSQ